MKSILSALAGAFVLGPFSAALHAEVMRLQPAPSPADNPLKGLVPYQGQGRDRFPHSLEFNYLSLDQLMTGPAAFSWQPMEAMLDDIASRGHQAIFRVWLEYPGQKSGVPRYLRDEGLKLTAWEDRGGEKAVANVTPDYQDERLVSALESFIAALGQRYDGDPRLGFITAGLLGAWGEWHCYPRGDLFASPATQQRVLAAYEKAFRKTPILLRYPVGKDDPAHAPNAQLPMGYHDDSFAWGTLEGGKGDEWFYLTTLKKAGEAAVNKWRTQPIGGEIRPELWGQIFDEKPAHPKAQDFAECVRRTHVTWLMDTGMFRTKAEPARYAAALKHVQSMGYDFHVPTAEISRDGSAVKVKLSVVNQGVAPFYQDWSLELAALDATGAIKERWPVAWKLTQLLPGDPARVWESTLQIPAKHDDGHTLALRVLHPLPQGKPLRFANAEQDRDAPGWLSLGKVP